MHPRNAAGSSTTAAAGCVGGKANIKNGRNPPLSVLRAELIEGAGLVESVGPK